jgi:hypothetical protein
MPLPAPVMMMDLPSRRPMRCSLGFLLIVALAALRNFKQSFKRAKPLEATGALT